MKFSLGFTTVRHAHFHMQANRIDFSLYIFTIVIQSFIDSHARLLARTRYVCVCAGAFFLRSKKSKLFR